MIVEYAAWAAAAVARKLETVNDKNALLPQRSEITHNRFGPPRRRQPEYPTTCGAQPGRSAQRYIHQSTQQRGLLEASTKV